MTVTTPPRDVVISGCGAAAELYYAPALRSLERSGRVRVTGLYDPAASSLEILARTFPRARHGRTLEELFETGPALVIVASPPYAHAAQSIAALDCGAAVLCEKPAAVTSSDVQAMAAAARSSRRFLAIGMVRRHFPACRAVKRLLGQGALGSPRRFSVFEGGPFRWPVRSPAYFDRERSGGGVLADIGPHVLDLLSWWLGALSLRSAADDAMGGVEANALLDVECGGVEGAVRLSRDWHRPNEVRIEAEQGVIRWSMDDLATVEVSYESGRCARLVEGEPKEREFAGCFEAMVTAVLDRIDDPGTSVVDVTESVPVVACIEQAYGARTRMTMPWMDPVAAVRAP